MKNWVKALLLIVPAVFAIGFFGYVLRDTFKKEPILYIPWFIFWFLAGTVGARVYDWWSD